MRLAAVLLVAAGCLLGWRDAVGGPAGPASLPHGVDVYFVENDLVYARFLALRRDGTYQQINKDPAACAEVDDGTWEQANGVVRFHSVHHAMRPRALLAGPLCVVLDSQEKVAALSALASTAARFAASTEDRVFAASDAGEFSAPPLQITVASGVETFTRTDLVSLIAQATDVDTAERTGIYPLSLLKTIGPTLLVPPDAVFGVSDLARVRRDYHVARDAAPPFYFAQVDARTFAREVGAWRTFHFIGQPD